MLCRPPVSLAFWPRCSCVKYTRLRQMYNCLGLAGPFLHFCRLARLCYNHKHRIIRASFKNNVVLFVQFYLEIASARFF